MQHYIDPSSVEIASNVLMSKSLRRIVEADGLITPILVEIARDGSFFVNDMRQAERVLVCRSLGWETILVEDSWKASDL